MAGARSTAPHFVVSTLFGFNESDEYAASHPASDDPLWGSSIQEETANAV